VVARGDLERRLHQWRAERTARSATLSERLEHIDEQERRLADSACPVIDKIRTNELAACSFLTDAQRDVGARELIEAELAAITDGSPAELALATKIADFAVPEAPDTRATAAAIAAARLQAKSLETAALWAARIPEAETYVAQENARIAQLRERLATKRTEIDTSKAELEKIEQQAPDGNTGTRLDDATAALRELEEQILATTRAIARIEGRLEELRAAAAEAEQLVRQITDAAHDVAAAKELVTAWRACRVMVLETSVIPAVEETANEILRRFPYGLQLQFATQRDRKSGDGQAETLDIEVLGGKGPIYELCSGGQQTVIDFALHVAIALVVSRRAGSRLRYMFLDEPAFLDGAGYESYAAAVRWMHETLGLTVLVSSHVRDLVDALGAQEFVIEPGPDGATLRAAEMS
jgi:DNA repair exonuclease SbcCD ATPase subunit